MDFKGIENDYLSGNDCYSELAVGNGKVGSVPTVARRNKLVWQILTEQHSPIVKDIEQRSARICLGGAERWITFPEDKSIIFPAETFLPKVQMKYVVEPKFLPRNVEMERRRRVYKNLKIEDALKAEGVKSRDMLPPGKICQLLSCEEKYDLCSNASYLPLELFDDEDYDCRTVNDWINLGIIDGVRYPLPATVFVEKNSRKEWMLDRDDKLPGNLYDWFPAAVTDYDSEKKIWTVLTLDGLKRKFRLPRIYVRFYAEDPREFARRVASAVKQRKIAETAIRYHFYLDCMPVEEGTPTPDEKQREIIILSATRRGLVKCDSKKNLSNLMDEIVLDYRRAMCDLTWRSLLAEQPEMFDFIARTEIDALLEDTEKAAPETAKTCTGMREEDFEEKKNSFHRTVLYVRAEVWEAMRCVAVECIYVSNMDLFISNYGKSMYLSEFESQKYQEIGVAIKYLRDTWLEKITQSVRLCLRDVGDEFDLEQKDRDAYNKTKLKRFADLVTHRMQNALRNLVNKSIALYLEMLETPAFCALKVTEDFAWGNDLVNTKFRPSVNPVFNIDITMNENSVGYSTDLESFEKVVINILDHSVRQCEQIEQFHPFLLPSLNFPKEFYLGSIGLSETEVCQVRDRLRTAYQKSIIPLRAYASEYRQYLGIYKLNVEKYVEDFKNADHTVVAIRDEISFHLRMKSILELELPRDIVIGPFRVNVSPLRRSLIQKRHDCCTKLLIMFASSLRARIEVVLTDYMQIAAKLRATPRNVEDLFEKRYWMGTVAETVKILDGIVRKRKHEYDILDYFRWNLSDEDFEAKWQAIRFPRQIQSLMDETAERFAIEHEKFHKIQVQDEILLFEKIAALAGNVTNVALQTDVNKVHEMAIEVKRIWKLMKECQESRLLLNKRQKLLGTDVATYEQLNKLMKEFEPYQILWVTASEWLKWQDLWMDSSLINVDTDKMENLVNDMRGAMSHCVKALEANPKVAAVALGAKNQIDAFEPYVGVMRALRDPGMKTRHFEELGAQTGLPIALTPALTFKNLLVRGIMNYEEIVKSVADAAAKEYSIERELNKMSTEWETITMEVTPYKNTGTFVMKISDEIANLLDDDILNVQQISTSPASAIFKSQIDEWEIKLRLIQDVIGLWTEVQKRWMYLEPIFSSDDINRQLPVETRKFHIIERDWRRIMQNAYECPYIITTCADKTLLESLKDCLLILETIVRGLSDYLETKRMVFPRFFFLSDNELLEIIIRSKYVRAVQPYLKKCFDNMRELRFEDDLEITKMYSTEYEEVALRPPIYPEGNVEDWLGTVEVTMRNTLREIIGESLHVVETTPRKKWVYMWPGQVVLCAGQTYWTAHVEEGIRHDTLRAFYSLTLQQLEALRKLIRGSQTEVQRLMLEAVITIEMHARDVLHKLIHERITSVNDFEWISQLRYYWIDGNLKIRAMYAEFSYEYEYLGNNGRLVITPLTERCYLTLISALHLKFGGAPAGPTGTGKTETTKDLAKAFAIRCVVFNCSDQLSYRSMGKFFKGLATSGAWTCFDEFNRIDIEVLSVVAQQIMTIQKAQQNTRANVFLFEGAELTLKPSCAVFITMNPGYAGRTELPDNLKALFRPVAMMVPNYDLIAEISLFSYGFTNAKKLARKITTTLKLCSEQLSTQDHYDFGMREVKTVIAAAGNMKREQRDLEEDQICLRALKDVNTPKFLKDDLKLFNGIVSDLFPGLVEKEVDYEILEASIRKSVKQMGLQDVSDFVRKVVQLYETTLMRSGLMLVGPTSSGKTKCYEILKHACTSLKGQLQPSGKPFTAIITHVLNPKAVTLGQLYGEHDLNTHEWTDGILPTLIRTDIEAADDDKRWYIFDGPIDAVWIENMNTVLDDNKKLCLTSGEIMKLLPTQTIMFEVTDLRVASPATVSRCGMVYMEPENLGLQPLINCWIQSLPATMNDYIEEITELTAQLVLPGLKMVRAYLREIINTVDSALVRSYINLMNFRIKSTIGRDEKAPLSSALQQIIPDLLSAWAAFAVVWGLGATCDYRSRCVFSDWLRKIQKDGRHRMPFPEEGLVYDYRLHDGFTDPIDGSQEPIPPKWHKWLDGIPSVGITPDTKYADIEVPTMDSARSATLIEHLLINETSVLCVGPTGSGKTLTVSAKLSRNMPTRYICDFATFSARTTANQTQDLIDAILDKRRKGVYGPPISKKQIFFIDDFNMPALDAYGAQPPLELIRQFMDFRGWYDRREIGSFRMIEDVNFIAAMGPPGGGGNPITARLVRHFHIIAFPEMEDDAKSRIFKTILNSWLSKAPNLAHMLDDLVDSALKIYTITRNEMLPTPNKSHYAFNLRDLSNVFQGVLMVDAKKLLHRRDKLLLLWYHENVRVYSDRLINDEDRKRFDRFLREALNDKFKCNVDDIVGDEPLFYGDFCSATREYEQITDTKKMEQVLLDFLHDYNTTTMSPMRMVLFEDAISHICRIMRILRQPGGNALLLGTSGSGRRSLTKLSSHIQEHVCVQIEINKTYTISDWRDDIKNILLRAGLQNHSIVFLFSDTQIKDDSMLEDLNNILNSGNVPHIYQADEVDKIYRAMRTPVQEAGLQINRSNLFSAYLKTVRNNLHVVLTMSPIGDTFRARIRQFPALVNCCTIDWFCLWPDTALESVATYLLSDIEDESITNETLRSIVRVCRHMHSSVIDASDRFLKELQRCNYVTPTSYLEMLSSYGDLLKKKKDELYSAINRLIAGLSKLADTEIEVKDMQDVLRRMRPELEKAAEDEAKMIREITRDTIKAEETKEAVKQQEAEASNMREQSKAIRDEAEADLSEVEPMLKEAEASLKTLNKNDIAEVKAMRRPPVGVLLVIEAMCIINDIKPMKRPGRLPGEKILDYWTPGTQMLADPVHFLYTMEHFRKEDITEEMINKLRNYIENSNFQPAQMLHVSKACYSLCLWVHAMYSYYFARKKVAPKIEALARAEQVLAETEKTLAAALAKLREAEEGIEILRDRLKEKEAKKTELEKQRQLCEERLARAVRLCVGLSAEQKRWIVMAHDIKASIRNAVGDILLSSGAVAYLTPFTDTYRRDLLASWRDALGDVPHTPNCTTPLLTLGNQMSIRNWHLNGLPRDSFSVENAVLAMNSKRWPLFIDPQAQANKWIRNMCKPTGLLIAKTTDKDLLCIVERCVRFGKACLIENVDAELESALDPVLTRVLFKHAGQPSVKIGDDIVPYNFDFRLYLTTKLPNPCYTSETAMKVLIVNFALTVSAFVDQMLSLIAIQERPDLEEARNALIVSNTEMKRELEEIDDRILHRLAVTEESVVDDIDLILSLEALKAKSDEIKAKMEAAERTQADIDLTRLLYIPLANRAQILFFCIADLQRIDVMYQYSLDWFITVLANSISSTAKSDDIEKRVLNIIEKFTYTLFSNVCRSLFEKHKLHFGFFVCARILLDNGTIDRKTWQHFLTSTAPIRELPNPAPEWITPRCWKEIQVLEELPKFDGFITSFERSLTRFKNIFDTQEAHLAPFPDPWERKLDDFEKLLVLKCLRPDKVVNAVQIYLTKHLGRQYVEPQVAELSAIYTESSNVTPIVFILSSGTDPAADLYKFADRLKMSDRLCAISLGQDQDPIAQAMLNQSVEIGNWVFFQNCHLAPSWMPKLESLIETLSPKDTHSDFRLWLTSAPSPDFPASILQNCSKMTVEPPRGVKANMLRAYLTQVTEMQEFLQSDHPKAPTFKWLIFSLCMFHSILLERRKFGPLGFNISYEFTNVDLAICVSQLYTFLMEYDALPFKVLKYTAGHINYGGRITDDWDRRCVLTLIEDYYNTNVVSPNYRFDQQGIYRQLSGAASYNDYLEYVKDLPLNDDPSLFGMHSNADISYAQAETYACLAALLNMQPREVGVAAAAAASVDEVTSRITNDMLAEMPEPFDLLAMQMRYPISHEESFNTVLLQEAIRYNDLLEIVQSTLQALSKALKGFVVMSEQLELMAASLFHNKVPANWQSKSYPSLKPLASWFHDLKERIKFISDWRDRGVPPAFWMSGFYFPQTFLTGTLQNFARKHVVSIDAIDFSYKVLSSKPTQRPSDGCVIYGLFLEGCRWNRNHLAESLPKELFTEMPPILLLPEVGHVIPGHGIYICPVYKTLERSGSLSTTGRSMNFVLAAEIPSNKPQSHWIKRGVALICALDY